MASTTEGGVDDLAGALGINDAATYTEEAVADIVQAIAYLNERNPTAAAKLDAWADRAAGRSFNHQCEGRWAVSPLTHIATHGS